MGVWEILLIVCCSLFVLTVFIKSIIRKKQGKTSCDCGYCNGNCSACKSSKKGTKV